MGRIFPLQGWTSPSHPPYYQTNWFRAFCVAFFLALLWGAYQFRVRQLRHQFNMTLEERVGERTRIARELHDTLLQSFQSLLPLFQAAIYKLPEGAVDARKTLEAAVDQASEAIGEGRDAVQGLRMSTVEKNDLAVAIRTVGEEFAAAENKQTSTAFKVVVEGTSRESASDPAGRSLPACGGGAAQCVPACGSAKRRG